MAFELVWERRGVYRRYRGDVTIAERLRSLDLICGDPRFDDLRFTITDFLAVETFEATAASTEEIAAMHIEPLRTNPKIVIAAVAVDNQVIAAIAHFKSLAFTTQPYSVFSTVEAARAWVATRCAIVS